jgi:hypothetical protein
MELAADLREYFVSLQSKLSAPFDDDEGSPSIPFPFFLLFIYFCFFLDFFVPPERDAFVSNVWKEAKGSEVVLSLDAKCSLSIDRLLLLSSSSQVFFFSPWSKTLIAIVV